MYVFSVVILGCLLVSLVFGGFFWWVLWVLFRFVSDFCFLGFF